MNRKAVESIISGSGLSAALKNISEKVLNGERINAAEGLLLLQDAPLALAGTLANYVRESKHGNRTYFNRNFHIEPTNVCV